MKKQYIAPAVELIRQNVENHLCVGTNDKEVERKALWGLSTKDVGKYGNDAWVNEGGYAQPEAIEDDNGVLNSSAKSFSAWDDEY